MEGPAGGRGSRGLPLRSGAGQPARGGREPGPPCPPHLPGCRLAPPRLPTRLAVARPLTWRRWWGDSLYGLAGGIFFCVHPGERCGGGGMQSSGDRRRHTRFASPPSPPPLPFPPSPPLPRPGRCSVHNSQRWAQPPPPPPPLPPSTPSLPHCSHPPRAARGRGLVGGERQSPVEWAVAVSCGRLSAQRLLGGGASCCRGRPWQLAPPGQAGRGGWWESLPARLVAGAYKSDEWQRLLHTSPNRRHPQPQPRTRTPSPFLVYPTTHTHLFHHSPPLLLLHHGSG